jgi:hypothetical protein
MQKSFKLDDMAEIFFLSVLQRVKTDDVSKQANSETTGAVKASKFKRETTQVTPEALEGKICAKAGRNT